MFFALKGENFDGNYFVEQALELGARYCVVDNPDHQGKDCILVDDVLSTLQQLATHHRNQLNFPIIALTGSNGKTTTKELINAVLSKKFRTIATIENLNNHIGVPLTILAMNKKTEIGIVEMGANHPKEIEFLCKIAQPDYGLITNFGRAHLEGFGSIEGVIRAKSELYDYLKAHQKTIFVNENDKIQVQQAAAYDRVLYFGQMDPDGPELELISSQPYVTLHYNTHTINCKLTGEYNFTNITAAIRIGSYFGVTPDAIASAIENYTPTNKRSQIIEKSTNTIILDTYNANPTSMMAAIENLKQLEKQDKTLILGDMFELGNASGSEHQNIVDYLENNKIGKVYLVGENFFNTITNPDNVDIRKFETFDTLKSELTESPIKDSTVLIKGSRGMVLERVLEFL